MKNLIESPGLPENILLTEEAVIEALDAHTLNAPEALEILGKYADQCHAEADREAQADPDSALASNRANLKAEIKIAQVGLKSREYKSLAIESLEQTLMAASQDEATEDLAEQITSILKSTE